jgi:prepilin-type N-terminal cleavage/methylation domain-containing protein
LAIRTKGSEEPFVLFPQTILSGPKPLMPYCLVLDQTRRVNSSVLFNKGLTLIELMIGVAIIGILERLFHGGIPAGAVALLIRTLMPQIKFQVGIAH